MCYLMYGSHYLKIHTGRMTHFCEIFFKQKICCTFKALWCPYLRISGARGYAPGPWLEMKEEKVQLVLFLINCKKKPDVT